MNELKIGAIAKNKAGREKGKLYIVVEIDDKYAYVADGDQRGIENPKRKNPKHLQPTKHRMQITIDKQSKDIPNENAKIRKEIRRIGKTEETYV